MDINTRLQKSYDAMYEKVEEYNKKVAEQAKTVCCDILFTLLYLAFAVYAVLYPIMKGAPTVSIGVSITLATVSVFIAFRFAYLAKVKHEYLVELRQMRDMYANQIHKTHHASDNCSCGH